MTSGGGGDGEQQPRAMMLGLQQWFMENGAERIEHPLEIVEKRERE
jgi:hypothetical protein